MHTRLRHAAVAALAALVSAAAGAAPSDTEQPAGSPSLEEVVVTGSRIATFNPVSTSPIQIVSAQEVKQQGATDVVELLNNLPQLFQNSATDFSNTTNPLTSPGGLTTANLRGLGPQRTLVLVDGRRLGIGDANTGNPNPAPDLDQIPAQLIERIDVVTGGASATYGSDAVGGVVNFIMKRDFEGIQLDAQYGLNMHKNGNGLMDGLLSKAGFPAPDSNVTDGRNRNFSLVMGANLGDHKGNVTGYFNYREADPVSQGSRDFSACKLNVSGTGTAPHCSGSASSNIFIQTLGPNAGNAYSVVGNDFLPYPQANSVPGPLFNSNPYQYLSRQDKRYSAGVLAHYDLSDQLKPYAEFSFMNDRSTTQIAPSALFLSSNPFVPTGGLLVNCDNPLLSAQQRTTVGCTAANIAAGDNVDLTIGRRNVEGGGRSSYYEHQNYRGVFGLKGSLGAAWNYDAYMSYYYTTLQQSNDHYLSWTAVNKALQVVDVNGTPTCKSVVDGSDTSCVPYNIFKDGGVTPAAVNYVDTFGTQYGSVEERILSASATGDLGHYGLRLPTATDGVGVAIGAEHRADALSFRPDKASLSGDLSGFGGAPVAIDASTHVQEYFGEVRVPLVQQKPGFEDAVLEAGYRHSNYDTSGGVNTWKLGLQYAPVNDIRFRASFQRAIRAPNIIDLYTPIGITNSQTLTADPCAGPIDPATGIVAGGATLAQCQRTGVTAAQYGTILPCPAGQCTTSTGGNPLLKPETANTLAIGFTTNPSFLPGFQASLDYYRIKITDEVNVIPNNVVFTDCLNTGNPAACAKVIRSSTGALVGASVAGGGYVAAPLENIAAASVAGYDLQAGYRWELGRFGTLSTALTGSLLEKTTTTSRPGAATYDCVGLYGPTCGTLNPRWRHMLRLNWQTPWNVLLSLNWRYIGKVSLETNTSDPTLGNGKTDTFDGTLHAMNYIDLSALWDVRPGVSLRAGINNLFDKDPPLVNSLITGTGAPNTYPTYDLLGRVFFLGMTAKF